MLIILISIVNDFFSKKSIKSQLANPGYECLEMNEAGSCC